MLKVKKAGVPLETLRAEATRLAMLQHAHVVRYFSACSFKKGKVFAIVTELLEGGSFAERVRVGASEQDVGRWTGEVASGLAHMHGFRMQHRDLKPDNVLFDTHGRPKIIDLGLACTLESKSRVSTKGGMVGTTLYMSPEKGSGKSYDGEDDVWALGCMLVAGLVGDASLGAAGVKPTEGSGANRTDVSLLMDGRS